MPDNAITYRVPEALYAAEQHLHGIVLTVTPIAPAESLHAGAPIVAERVNVATVFSFWDAYLVADLHAKAHGFTLPLIAAGVASPSGPRSVSFARYTSP